MYLNPFEERESGQSGPSKEPRTDEGSRLNINKLWGSVYRSRFAILACIAAGLALAVVVTLLMHPIYRASATVEVKLEAQKVLGTEAGGESQQEADRFLQTELDIIRSRSMAQAVAEDLGLFGDPRFLDLMKVKFDDSELAPRLREDTRRQVVIGTLLKNLSVDLSSKTRIAVIEFESPDPTTAARVTNSYAQNFIKLNLRRKSDASRYSLDFLKDQLAEAQARLSESEQRAVDYARRTRIIDPGVAAQQNGGTDAPRSLTTATLVQLNTDAATAISRRITAGEKWRRTQAANLLNIPEVLTNPAIQTLIQQKAQLQSEYEDQLQRRQADFPATKQLAARVSELDRQITALASDVRNSILQDYRVARSQEQGIQSQLNLLKTSTLNEQNQGIQLSILRREAQTNRQQFDSLLARYNQLNAESGVQLNNLSIIDTAEVPGAPVSPKLILNIALGLLLGMAAAAAYVLGREHLFDMVRAPDDITDRLGVSLLGAIPVARDDLMTELKDTKSPVSEAFSAVRTSMLFASGKGVPGSLMVTSTQASEGKSTACFALAASLAHLGKRVVIVDADLRRPNVHRLLDIKNGKGVSDVLIGGATIDSVLVKGQREGVDAITTGAIPVNPADLLASSQFSELIRELETRYEHVLIDSAPVLGLADAPLVAAQVQATVFVIEAGRTRVRGAVDAMERLTATGGNIIGAILSRFDPTKLGYSHEYQYGYNYEYGS